MVMTERANSREEATQRGQQLIVGNLLCSATEERDFADSKHALYRCVRVLCVRGTPMLKDEEFSCCSGNRRQKCWVAIA